jgi:hypothetical protein
MHSIRQEWNNSHNSLPKKWITMGSMKLRALVLKAEAEYSKAKYDTMVLSEKTTKKVKRILKELNAFVTYDNGYIVAVSAYSRIANQDLISNKESMTKYAKEHELNRAIETLLKD